MYFGLIALDQYSVGFFAVLHRKFLTLFLTNSQQFLVSQCP